MASRSSSSAPWLLKGGSSAASVSSVRGSGYGYSRGLRGGGGGGGGGSSTSGASHAGGGSFAIGAMLSVSALGFIVGALAVFAIRDKSSAASMGDMRVSYSYAQTAAGVLQDSYAIWDEAMVNDTIKAIDRALADSAGLRVSMQSSKKQKTKRKNAPATTTTTTTTTRLYSQGQADATARKRTPWWSIERLFGESGEGRFVEVGSMHAGAPKSLADRLSRSRVRHYAEAAARACGAIGGRSSVWHEARRHRNARVELADSAELTLWELPRNAERQLLLQSISCGARVRLLGLHHVLLMQRFRSTAKHNRIKAKQQRIAASNDNDTTAQSIPAYEGWLHVASDGGFDGIARILEDGDAIITGPPTSCVASADASKHVAAAVEAGRALLTSPTYDAGILDDPDDAFKSENGDNNDENVLQRRRRRRRSLQEDADSSSSVTAAAQAELSKFAEAVAVPPDALSSQRNIAALRKFFGVGVDDEPYGTNIAGSSFDRARGVRLIAIGRKRGIGAMLRSEEQVLILPAPDPKSSERDALKQIRRWSALMERFTKKLRCPAAPQGRCNVLVRGGPLTPLILGIAAKGAPMHSFIDASIFFDESTGYFQGLSTARKRLSLWRESSNMTTTAMGVGEPLQVGWPLKDTCELIKGGEGEGMTVPRKQGSSSSLRRSGDVDTALESDVPCIALAALSKVHGEEQQGLIKRRVVPRDSDVGMLLLGLMRCRTAFIVANFGMSIVAPTAIDNDALRAANERAERALAVLHRVALDKPYVPQFAGVPLPRALCSHRAGGIPRRGTTLTPAARLAVAAPSSSHAIISTNVLSDMKEGMEKMLSMRLASGGGNALILTLDADSHSAALPSALRDALLRMPGLNCTAYERGGGGQCDISSMSQWALEKAKSLQAGGLLFVSMGLLTPEIVAHVAERTRKAMAIIDARGVWDSTSSRHHGTDSNCDHVESWNVHVNGCVSTSLSDDCIGMAGA
ncbi:hypothetical protein NFJ02_36g92030 [Pycnococcus provasolii]